MTRWLLPILLCTVMFGQEPRPQPVDVPAITVEQSTGICEDWTPSENGLLAICTKKPPINVRSCLDTSRILLHSENGHYYCHKPQTSPALEPKPCHLAIIWPFDDQRAESAMKVRICSTEEK